MKKHINTSQVENPLEGIRTDIPLLGIEYRTALTGSMVRVRSIQKYRNAAAKSVEAVYVFPLPDEASVVGCRMIIGDRKITATIKEREAARQEYRQAVDAGHHGALMEQERPNIFTMNVGGIEPGEEILVEVDYVQRVPWQEGGGRFSIPLVVAPRFIPGNPTGQSGGGWAADTDEVPDASRITPVVAKEGVSYNASIRVLFSPGITCRLSSPSHGTLVEEQKVGKGKIVEIVTGEIRTDRDFVLTYRSLSNVPETAIHTGQHGTENFSLITIYPPGDVQPGAKNVLFVLDGSGSMQGAKIAGLKTIVKKGLEKLRSENPGNRAGIIVFSSHPAIRLLIPLGAITDEMIETVSSITAEGCTKMGAALTAAYGQLQMADANPANTIIVLVADGQSEDTVYTKGSARIVSVGIDSAINDSLLKRLAKETGGTCVSFLPGEDFDRASNTVLGMVSGPVLRDISVEGGGDAVGIQDVFKGMPATVAIRHGGDFPKEIRISGKYPSGADMNWRLNSAKAAECDFAASIWARELIRETTDNEKQLETSLRYGVICSQTAFVAISEKEVPGEKPVKVEIPVNLPHTWDYGAIFGQNNTVHCLFGMTMGPDMHSLMPDFDDGMIRGVNFSKSTGRFTGGGLSRKALAGREMPSRVRGILPTGGRKPLSAGPPTLPVSPSANGRFSTDAPDQVDRLVGILIAASLAWTHTVQEAQKKLNLELTPRIIASWDEEKRCRAYYFAAKLLAYGLKFESGIFKALGVEPKQSDTAQAWYALARRELGLPFGKVPFTYEKCDGGQYILWKFGLMPRPSEHPWDAVP